MKKILLPVLILLLLVTPAYAIDVNWGGIQYICAPTTTPPIEPQPCTFTYSACGPCRPDGTCPRTETGRSPVGCVGTPILSEPCIYVPPPVGCSPPSYVQALALDYRYTFSFSVGETTFSIPITANNITRIKGQVIGLSGETDVIGTWIMPDCNHFEAYASGTDNGAILDIRSKHAVQPNINDEYVPIGNHTFKIKANAQSNVIVWFTTYN